MEVGKKSGSFSQHLKLNLTPSPVPADTDSSQTKVFLDVSSQEK
jgi:hypothetical protein